MYIIIFSFYTDLHAAQFTAYRLPLDKYRKHQYEADIEGGYVEGELFQVVEEGQSGTPVMAVAEEGWAFYEWSDGNTDPYRIDEEVTENITVVAVFIELMDAGDTGGVGGDEPGDLPADLGQGGDSPGKGPGAGGEYKPTNQVIDGQTYYGKIYGVELEDVLAILSQDTEMPEELKLLIANDFETIKVNAENEENASE